ncbi:hypothetical protein ACI3L1_19530 [Deinococcus sp. SM5_A1]|uniref:hypothetical protein n=1 Tax=Deinococcus sp. SM5_A1 TaxID=3379094 RepID=UPI00385FAE0F
MSGAELTDKKVTGSQALLLAQKHSLETIEQTIKAFEMLLKTEYRSKVRNTTGLLISMLEKPNDYTNILSSHSVSMKPGSSAPTQKQKKSRTVPSVDAAAPVERVPKMALTVLLDQFDATLTRRTLRDRVIQLYVGGQVELLELTQLVNTTDEDATRLVGEWQERSDPKAV